MQFVTTHPWSGALFGGPLVLVPPGSVYDGAFVDIAALRAAGVPLVPLTDAMQAALGSFRAQLGQGKALAPELTAFLMVSAGGAAVAGYTPGEPRNWQNPRPTTVQEAIDRIAAVVGGGGQNPIP